MISDKRLTIDRDKVSRYVCTAHHAVSTSTKWRLEERKSDRRSNSTLIMLKRWRILMYKCFYNLLCHLTKWDKSDCALPVSKSKLSSSTRDDFHSMPACSSQLSKCGQTIKPIIAISEMLPQRDIPDRIPVASSIFRGKISKLVPISAAVELAISCCFVPKCIEGSVVCIAHSRLSKACQLPSPQPVIRSAPYLA